MASIKSSTLCALAAVSALGNWNSIAADAGSVEERLKKLETQVDGLQKENTELKKIVADLTLDNRMLKDVNSRKW